MSKSVEIPELKLKIVGHRFVTKSHVLEDGSREDREELQVTMEGVDGNRATKLTRFVDPEEAVLYPLREIVTWSGDCRQQRIPLANGKSRGAATSTN